jgi:7-cyano-7-deazaguanine synthase in queuosine biosynthesis
MNPPSIHIVLANGASAPHNCIDAIALDYRTDQPCDRRIYLSLPDFVRDLYYLPDRTLDLLELASYVFAADRYISRGQTDAVEYHSWSRNINLVIRVRDYDFWKDTKVSTSLIGALNFMMGDDWSLTFQPGHVTPPTGLFDDNRFHVKVDEHGLNVALFSGGVDSLAGAIGLLESGKEKLILASHQASTSARKTQRYLYKALEERYPQRVHHYPFECNLQGKRAVDETQRSRSFLFTSIAYALSTAYKQSCFYVFENGITSINLHRREDLANSRASRTTHPQTIAKLQKFFSLVAGEPFRILHPFLDKTKADIINNLCNVAPNLLSSSVSCSRAPFAKGDATHCGKCFQCIDRRIAAFASGRQELDHPGLYTFDIVSEPLDHEAKTVAIDYIRQAISFAGKSPDDFHDEYLLDISQIIEYLPFSGGELDRVEKLWNLYHKHGNQVREALSAMRAKHDDVFSSGPKTGSLLEIISQREYLKPDAIRLADALVPVLVQGVTEMFAKNRPNNEPDLNDKIGALLRTHDEKFRSEYPTVSFACARVIPDHQSTAVDILVEAKYIRKKTTPSVATEGIAADLTKCPKGKFIIFIVYDPDHAISSDKVFTGDIEAIGRNRVVIIR